MRTDKPKSSIATNLRCKIERFSIHVRTVGLVRNLAAISGITLFCGVFVPIFSHSFLPSQATFMVSMYLCTVLTIIATGGYVILRRQQKLESIFDGSYYSKIQIALLYPFMPVMIYFIFWSTIGILIPQAINIFIGTKTTIHSKAITRSPSKKVTIWCRHELHPTSPEGWFFYQCIPRRIHDSLPHTEIDVILHVKQSALGTYLYDIQLYP